MFASASREFRAGAVALAPLLVGVVPFGMIYGALALSQGLSPAAALAMSPAGFLEYLKEAAQGLDLRLVGEPSLFDDLPESTAELVPSGPGELAYLQYTSGSTRFPRGVAITHASPVVTRPHCTCTSTCCRAVHPRPPTDSGIFEA